MTNGDCLEVSCVNCKMCNPGLGLSFGLDTHRIPLASLAFHISAMWEAMQSKTRGSKGRAKTNWPKSGRGFLLLHKILAMMMKAWHGPREWDLSHLESYWVSGCLRLSRVHNVSREANQEKHWGHWWTLGTTRRTNLMSLICLVNIGSAW